jgi:hypothetical protein
MTKQRGALAPIRKTITVQATPPHAFEAFTSGMNSWWPADYTPFPREAIVIEPRAGGRWYKRGSEGSETTNGKVIQWDPPGRLLLPGSSTARGSSIPSSSRRSRSGLSVMAMGEPA